MGSKLPKPPMTIWFTMEMGNDYALEDYGPFGGELEYLLPISDDLRDSILQWAQEHEDFYAGTGTLDVEGWEARGRALATRLQDELGPGYRIRYETSFPDPPPDPVWSEDPGINALLRETQEILDFEPRLESSELTWPPRVPDDPQGFEHIGGYGNEVRAAVFDVRENKHGRTMRIRYQILLPCDGSRDSGVPREGSFEMGLDQAWLTAQGLDNPTALAEEIARRTMAAALADMGSDEP